MRRRRRHFTSEPLEQRVLLAAFDIREVARLFPEVGAESLTTETGESVAIEGNIAVVGAPSAASGTDSTLRGGAAFVFQLNEQGTLDPADDVWAYAATLSPQTPRPGTRFGFDVAINGGVIVVGASNWQSKQGWGAAFVFTEPPTGWAGNLHEAARLEASKSTLFLGASVAIDGDTIAVSANNYNSWEYSPASFGMVYQKPTSGWNGVLTESAVLVAKLPDQYLNSTSIDIDSNTVVLGGAFGSLDAALPDAGLAGFVFTRPTSGWNGVLFHRAILRAADITGNSGFGGKQNDLIAIDGETVVIGAPGYDGAAVNSGAVVLFQMPVNGWQGTISRSALLVASSPVKDAILGLSVSIDDNTVAAAGFNWYDLRLGFSGFIFSRPANGWNSLQTETSRLAVPLSAQSVAYGTSIAIRDGQVIVGSPGADSTGPESGALTIYRKPQNDWSSTGQLPVPASWSGGPPDWGRSTERPSLFFGHSVAIDGDTAVVGTHRWDTDLHKQVGRVWVYRNAGSNWVRVAELQLRNEQPFSTLGTSIAMQGSTIAVGAAWSGDNGAVYVFSMPSTGWSGNVNESATLTVLRSSEILHLGQKVDIDGDTIVAGGDAIGTAGGRARPIAVFTKSGDTWTDSVNPSALVVPQDPDVGDRFGAALAIHGDHIAVGSPGAVPEGGEPRLGAAYVFSRPLTGWNGVVPESAKLVPGDGSPAPYFSDSLEIGYSVDIHHEIVVLGSRSEGDPDWTSNAFVFDRTELGWSGLIHETARLRTSISTSGIDTAAVTLSDSHLVLGVPTGGRSFLYERPAAGWTGDLLESAILKTSDDQPIGYPVAMSNDHIILGAPNYSNTALFSGAATILSFTPSPDFGDAPDSYHTTRLAGANGGARHRPVAPRLGALRDSEDDASGILNGQTDDQTVPGTTNVDDEDGVIVAPLILGSAASVSVTVSDASGRIFGWIDFNRDGDFADAGERILDGSQMLAQGTHQLQINVPATAATGSTFARFRLSTDSSLSWDGPAPDGEVEDYAIEISDRVPRILRPASVELDNRPVFEWTAVPGTAAYEIWLTYTLNNSVIFQNLRVAGTSFRPSMSLRIGQYSLWVRSVAADGTFAKWSLPDRFRIATGVTLHSPPARHERTPTFRWEFLAGAVTYDFWLENATTGQRVLVKEGLTGAATSFMPDLRLNAGQYRFWVRGRDSAGVAAIWSLPGQFEIGLHSISLNGPSFSDRPLITWENEIDIESYEIYVSGNGTLIQQASLSGPSWRPLSGLAPGAYRFWVRGKATVTGRLTPWSAPTNFNTTGQTVVMSPVALSQTSSPDVSWQAVEGASRYRVQIQDRITSTNVFSGQTVANTELPIRSILPDGLYRVWVQAISSTGAAGYWSLPADFEVRTVTTNLTVNPMPPTWVTEGRPRFQWAAPLGAFTYDLYLSDGEQVTSINRLAATSFTPDSRLADGNWQFWVRAVTEDGKVGAWSAPYSLTIGSTPLLSVVTGSGARGVELRWIPVYGAARYDVYIQNLESGLITSAHGILTSTFSTASTLSAGRYRAWVRAISETQTAGVWSLPVDFLITAAAV